MSRSTQKDQLPGPGRSRDGGTTQSEDGLLPPLRTAHHLYRCTSTLPTPHTDPVHLCAFPSDPRRPSAGTGVVTRIDSVTPSFLFGVSLYTVSYGRFLCVFRVDARGFVFTYSTCPLQDLTVCGHPLPDSGTPPVNLTPSPCPLKPQIFQT